MAELGRTWKAIVASTALTIAGAAHLAIAQQFDPRQNSRLTQSMSNYWAPNNPPALGQLANNEALVVDLKGVHYSEGRRQG